MSREIHEIEQEIEDRIIEMRRHTYANKIIGITATSVTVAVTQDSEVVATYKVPNTIVDWSEVEATRAEFSS